MIDIFKLFQTNDRNVSVKKTGTHDIQHICEYKNNHIYQMILPLNHSIFRAKKFCHCIICIK